MYALIFLLSFSSIFLFPESYVWSPFCRWDFSNTDGLKKKDMAAGVDEVITCPSRVQQLRDTLTTLGVPIDHLDYNKSPRAVFSSWNNTPVLAR